MRRAVALALVLGWACASSRSPDEAAKASDVQVTDGFKYAGGVIIKEQHVLTQASIVKGVEDTSILDGAGRGHRARVAARNLELNAALLYVETGGLTKAVRGDSAALKVGDALAVQVFDAQGKPSLKTGTFKAWRYADGRALLETDFDTAEIAGGAGVFGPDGKLVGVLAHKLGPRFTYATPIEYFTNGPKPITGQTLGEKKDAPGFAAIRAEAAKHTESLPTPKSYEVIDEVEYSYSKSAIVGWMRLLDKKVGGAHGQPLKWKVEAVDQDQHRKIIGEGKLDGADVKWVAQGEARAALVKTMTAAFGDGWVKEHLEPNDYGELRFRIPLAPLCPKVTDREVHNLSLTLADGRAPQVMGFNDMVNICAADEDAVGGEWEKAWGFAAPVVKAAPKKVAPTRGGKKKGRRR